MLLAPRHVRCGGARSSRRGFRARPRLGELIQRTLDLRDTLELYVARVREFVDRIAELIQDDRAVV